jgi:hypothetical protein
MNVLHRVSQVFLGLALFPSEMLAQEVQRDVVPGREFSDTKVLTPGQSDLWSIDCRPDEVLKCHVTASDLDPVLDLLDEQRNVLASDDGAGSQSYVQYRVARGGKLQFRVRGFQGAGGGRYTLSLERYVASPLALGAEMTGAFPRERWFHVRLQLEKDDRFVPVVTGGRLTSVVQFAANAGLGENLGAYTAPEAGEYHLRIEGDERTRFSLRTLVPVYREAVPGEPFEATVPPFGLDIVHMKLPAGAASMLDLAMPSVQLQQWHRLLGEDPRWRELGNAQKGGRSRRLFQPERDLDLQLWLRNLDGSAANYEFSHLLPDRALAAEGATQGTLPLGNLGCYTLSAIEGEVLTLRVRADGFDPAMVVCAPNGETLACLGDSGPLDRDPSLTFCAPFSGQYRVIPYAEGHTGSGLYRVEVTRELVPALTFDHALELRAEPGHDAYARITLAAGQEVWLSCRSRECDTALSMDDDQGPRLGTWEGGGTDRNVLCAVRAPRAGSYTVFVHSRAGAGICQLRAFAVE